MKVRSGRTIDYTKSDRLATYAIDKKAEIIEFYEEFWPLIKRAAGMKNIDEMLKNFSPAALLILMHQAMNGQSERVRQDAARELLHMSEGKPIQRQVTMTRNVDKMPEAEVDSMIRGLLRAARRESSVTVKALPVPVDESEDPK